MARILMSVFGSHGDLNPFLAVGLELKRRGHGAVIATSPAYRGDVENLGLGFAPVRPDLDAGNLELYRRIMEPRRGSEVVVRLMMEHVRESYADLEAAAGGADLLVSHVITYAAPVLAEKLRMKWVSTVLSPMVFFSAYDPPVLASLPALSALRGFGPDIHRPLLRAMKFFARGWSGPVRTLRRDLGLAAGADPVFEGQHSPHGVLALFSRHLAAEQPDWPSGTRLCGFPFLDQDFAGKPVDPGLEPFLSSGPPPVVFTLGSSAVKVAGDFYRMAAEACAAIGARAVLVCGAQAEKFRAARSDRLLAVASAPYHWLFARAAAVVHQGGMGTTAHVLRCGRPMVVAPFAHDQFDNADRCARLGLARVLFRRDWSARGLVRALRPVLEGPQYGQNARRMGERIRAEDGARAAGDAVEAILGGKL